MLCSCKIIMGGEEGQEVIRITSCIETLLFKVTLKAKGKKSV